MKSFSRRRFISIAASATALPYAATASAQTASWRGVALGSGAQMKIAGLSQAEADPIFRKAEAEIDRLENMFSVYRPDSTLCLLNRNGSISLPPMEMLELFSLCSAVHAATGGAFDPSVQPVWKSVAEGGGSEARTRALELVDWNQVTFGTSEIRLGKSGMALTLNGIAQGYIADRVALIMRREGLSNLVIDTGEVVALGRRSDGGAWRAGIAAPGSGGIRTQLGLVDRALATSAPMGSTIGGSGVPHIINPITGIQPANWEIASVSAGSAALADGLSTAFILMDAPEIESTLRVFETAKLEYLS